MPTDVSGLDPLSVSLRDYIDEKQVRLDKELIGHAERHQEQHHAHKHVHDLENEAITTLASLVAAQRTEDAKSVEVALEAVQRAAHIHAIAHEQQHAAHQAIHDVEKEAIVKATEQMDRRLEAMNGFRDALRDAIAGAMPRELGTAQTEAVRRETLAQLEDLRTTLLALNSRMDVTQGQSKGSSSTIGYFFAAAGLMLSVIAVIAAFALR